MSDGVAQNSRRLNPVSHAIYGKKDIGEATGLKLNYNALDILPPKVDLIKFFTQNMVAVYIFLLVIL